MCNVASFVEFYIYSNLHFRYRTSIVTSETNAFSALANYLM